MNTSTFFVRFGGSLWLVAVGGSALVLALTALDVVGKNDFPWRQFWVVFGAGGLGSMILAGVFTIWEK